MTVMKVKKKIVIFFVIFAVILIIYNKSALFKATPNDPVEKDPTDASTCVEVSKKNRGNFGHIYMFYIYLFIYSA